mmetsp:Transcript_70572/g.132056  ORF Transcript_70572/g.132056 Transcript_70572/m.132056 type:complete len:272 (-) Transcript_70572:129-944(-)
MRAQQQSATTALVAAAAEVAAETRRPSFHKIQSIPGHGTIANLPAALEVYQAPDGLTWHPSEIIDDLNIVKREGRRGSHSSKVLAKQAAILASMQSQLLELTAEVEEHRLARKLAEADATEAVMAARQAQEDSRRAAAEAAASAAQVEQLQQEREALRSRFRGAERATMASDMKVRALTAELNKAKADNAKNGSSNVRSVLEASSLEEVIQALVSLELRTLTAAAPEERVAEKRRLLLRWHPDKNASGGGASGELATKVIQELRSHPEWTS